MSDMLKNLALKAGLTTHFSDAGLSQKNYEVSENIIRFVLSDMGYANETQEQIENSLRQIEDYRWQQVLESIYVCPQDNLHFDVVAQQGEEITEFLLFDDKNKKVLAEVERVGENEHRYLDGKNLQRGNYRLKNELAIGYYVLGIRLGNKIYRSQLAVAPKHSYQPQALDKKIWGFAIQLYSVNSERNWGVGDFTDLSNLVRLAAKSGAAIIGLNPLNTLAHDYPENASPYQSISRLFLNPIYIDVEAVPEFRPADKQELATEIAAVKKEEFINYDKIYRLKIRALEKCYQEMILDAKSKRNKDFQSFCNAQGRELDNLAAFQALYEEQTQTIWGGWQAWPQEYRSPSTNAVSEYVLKNQERVDFFKFMQFEAARQFAAAQKTVEECKLGIGFYRDLAVGVGKDSAEFWSNAELFIPHVGAGAPPDAFFPAGQKWGLGCFSPQVLKERQYEPFIKILRANMQNAGAIRVDHVMSLMRLFIIPDDLEGGTYLHYHFEDMLNLLTLESHINQCMVVGESIGNVPDGFLAALEARQIYSLSVLWAERSGAGWGGFYAPEHYPHSAVTSVGTHDMPPLKMWWFGYDIELSSQMGMINEQEKVTSYHKREADRKHLLNALDAAGVWPQDRLRSGDYLFGEGYPQGLDEAVHRFMSKSNSQVFLLQPEDALQVDKQQNLPGTDKDKYPNWRRRLPVELEKLEANGGFMRNIAAIKKER